MARTAAAVLFVLVCCLLVGSAPARRPAELPAEVVLDAVDHEASAEPLLPKPVTIVEAADPRAVLSSVQAREVDPAHQAPQVFRCGGEDIAVSEQPPSMEAQSAGKGGVEEEGQEQPDDSDSDTDGDSDSDDDEDNEGGIVGWLWRLARRF